MSERSIDRCGSEENTAAARRSCASSRASSPPKGAVQEQNSPRFYLRISQIKTNMFDKVWLRLETDIEF